MSPPGLPWAQAMKNAQVLSCSQAAEPLKLISRAPDAACAGVMMVMHASCMA